jgi:hypothetical protein
MFGLIVPMEEGMRVLLDTEKKPELKGVWEVHDSYGHFPWMEGEREYFHNGKVILVSEEGHLFKVDPELIIAPECGVLVIQPDGTAKFEKRESNEAPDLKELQGYVGGYIEAVDAWLPSGTRAWANEEGLLQGLDVNLVATSMVKWRHPIVGPVVILYGFRYPEDEAED